MGNRKLFAGNWKMHGLAAPAQATIAELEALQPEPPCDVLICPPATLIRQLAGGPFPIGGQDCHWDASGAHTGDISAEMLADAGAVAVILGHSERRQDHGETDDVVARKVAAAWRAGLAAIVCVGETEAERDAGRTLARVQAQLAGSIPDGGAPATLTVAYEPVWAIGTGRTASPDEIAEVHDFVRGALRDRFGPEAGDAVRILYGGSVKPGNAVDIMTVSNVDGALVGGASLAARDAAAIMSAAAG